MTTLWLVRHGPTHQKSFCGWRDVPADLSDHAQIERLNTYLPEKATLISSDLLRARQTADVLTGHHHRMDHSDQLREFNFGIWDGMSFDQVATRDPDLSRQFWEKPGHLPAPEGESWYDVAWRVSREVDNLIDRCLTKNLIIVAHFGAILTQVARAAGHTPVQAFGQHIDNLSVSRIRVEGKLWHLEDVNVTPD